jgi:alkanesulfonate monooxygenase SsuD/methylene tetrahydromethanopterin reductase-like flavin-dependent oxidoreductase (luciferase family)
MSATAMQIGLVLPMLEQPHSGEKPSWATIKAIAQGAEATGFDTVWIADGLLWRVPDWPGPEDGGRAPPSREPSWQALRP